MALPYELVTDMAAKVGLVVLQADETIENDMRRLLPDTAELLVSRVRSSTTVSSESLQEMARVLTGSAALFPVGARFDVIGYGCTSGTAQIGAETIATLIRDGAESNHITEPVSALVAACRALGVNRIGLISPYVAQVSDQLCGVLANHGIDVLAVESFDEAEEANVVRIAPRSIQAAAYGLWERHKPDAIFLSCTNLRTLDIIAPLEALTGVPVLSSNLVLAWHILQLAGQHPAPHAPGRVWAHNRA